MTAPTPQVASRAQPVLSLRGLSKRFRRRLAVDDLSLDVRRGDVFGFLGPNGAGKTTTLRMIVGLIRPTAGSVSVAGETIGFWRRSALTKIGAIIEGPAFYDYLSGRDNLRMLASLGGGCAPSRLDEVLERVDLTQRADDPVRVYSQGMRQRLAIAAALVPGPELILLDEPTNGLDPMGIRDVRRLIASLADDGYTVFLSSHLLVEVEQLCNRGAILMEGKKIWEGEVADVMAPGRRIRLDAHPRDRVEAALAEAHIAWRAPEAAHNGGGDLYFIDGADHQPEDLVDRLVAAGCRVRAISAELPTLEEVFVELVEGAP